MLPIEFSVRRKFLRAISLVLPAAFAPGVSRVAMAAASDAPVDPWTPEQTVEPSALVKELAEAGSAEKITVVCVAPHAMYIGGHIHGALYHGPAGSADGLADLKKWADAAPRSASIVIYCGCCPMERCPNLRPAFVALRDIGFTRLRALVIPTNFYTDWVKLGFTYDKLSAQ